MMKLILAATLTAFLCLGCSHPLEIVNEGDILSSSGNRDCSLPQYRAGLDNCRVNIVTGDYSRGAAGFWVENGEIQYPVHEITIAGNLTDMLMNIAAVGAVAEHRGSIQTGSILLENMQVAGE